MAHSYKGGRKTLSATFEPLDTEVRRSQSLTIRSAIGNATVELSADGANTCGFLQAGEARTFPGVTPPGVYVKGTAGQSLYWDVCE